MSQIRSGREVFVAGVGLHPFGRFSDKDLAALALEAVVEALKDAGVRWRDIPVAYFGHVYYQGMSVGETALAKLGLTGIPIINVENACSSGSTAFWQAYWGITTGVFDLALAFGAEKVPRGPVTVTAEESPDRYIGADHMMAGYGLRMRRYMEETGAPLAALAPGGGQRPGRTPLSTPTPTASRPIPWRRCSSPVSYRRPFDTVPVLSHQRGSRRGYSMRGRRPGTVRIRQGTVYPSGGGGIALGQLQQPGQRPFGFSPYRTEPCGHGCIRDERPGTRGRGPGAGTRRRIHRRAAAAERPSIYYPTERPGSPPRKAAPVWREASPPTPTAACWPWGTLRRHRYSHDPRDCYPAKGGSRCSADSGSPGWVGPVLRRGRRDHGAYLY